MKKLRCLRVLVAVGIVVSGLGRNLAVGTGVARATEDDISDNTSEVIDEDEGKKTEILSAEESSAETTENNEETGKQGEDAEEIKVAESVVIKSFNPGYPGVGEFFELKKLRGDVVLLAGLTVVYTTSSGKEYEVYKFPEGSEMVGESLLMRLSSSDEVKEVEDFRAVADEVYTRNMAQGKGMIELKMEGETFEMLCWGFENEACYLGFNPNKPTTLVRNGAAEEMEELFEHIGDYIPDYSPEEPGLIIREAPEEIIEPRCRSLEFSEIFTYFENSAEEQFVEMFNRGEERVDVSECGIRYKNKVYLFGNEKQVGANDFLTIYPFREWGLSLTKNPTSMNTLEIIDADGEIVDTLSYFSGQRKGVSLAMLGWTESGQEIWRQTYGVTSGAENIYQEFKTCPVGKVINLETGNCVNETNIAPTLAACPEGKYRNPLTGRCKAYATTASAELKPCAEGYERNPETGRCRKIRVNDGAEYPVEVKEAAIGKREFVAIWAIVAVIVAGVGYIIFQYREEIKRLIKR